MLEFFAGWVIIIALVLVFVGVPVLLGWNWYQADKKHYQKTGTWKKNYPFF